MCHKAELQPRIDPVPTLRKRWGSGKVVCKDEGWSFSMSASAGSRIDNYHYEENGRGLTFGGEGGPIQMDVFIPEQIFWDDDLSRPLETHEAMRILHNITAAIQWSGWNACFIYD